MVGQKPDIDVIRFLQKHNKIYEKCHTHACLEKQPHPFSRYFRKHCRKQENIADTEIIGNTGHLRDEGTEAVSEQRPHIQDKIKFIGTVFPDDLFVKSRLNTTTAPHLAMFT